MKYKIFKTSKDISPSLPYQRFPAHRESSQLEPWPRRLLHVPSMTSYERQSGNRYNGVKEPGYNAFSYTWGRFEDNGEAPINIKGVSWKIPGISSSHFTANDFQKAIEAATGINQFLWLDVACIDQENEAIKMDEVNNQAAIYRRALWVYAWLVPWTTDQMFQAFHTMDRFAELLGCPQTSFKLEPLGLQVAVDLDSVCGIFQSIAKQDWFTSLWTLQEGFLSRPRFLSKSSDCCYYRSFFDGEYQESKFPIGINWVAGVSRNIWDDLRSNPDPRAVSICQSMEDCGLLSMSFHRDPYLLYPAALKRYVGLPQDAVYAIMHVFGVRMPTMNDTNRLLLKLAIFLNHKDPVAYQIFVHQVPVELSKAWRMNKNTHLPFQFFRPALIMSSCTVEAHNRYRPKFTGKMTTLENIASYWAEVQQKRKGSQKMPYLPNVFLDATPSSNCTCLQLEDSSAAAEDAEIGKHDDRYTEKLPLRDFAGMLPLPIQRYRVLLLGSWEGTFFPGTNPPPVSCVLRYDIGLVVLQEDMGKDKPWFRAGFSAWLTWSRKDRLQALTVLGDPDTISVPFEHWQNFECLIGG